MCQVVPFSLKLEVKDANRNSTGCFSKIYVTGHQSNSISLAFEASVPPLFSVQRDPKSGSWLRPRGVFSEDAATASAHTYCTTQACPCFKVSSADHCLLFLSIECCTFPLALGSLQDFAPETARVWKQVSQVKKCFRNERSFPCSVIRSPPLHFPIAFSCKQDDLQTTGFARRLTSGGAIIVPVIKIQIFNLLQILFLHLGYRGQYILGLGRTGLLQEFTCWRTRKPPERKGYISQKNIE